MSDTAILTTTTTTPTDERQAMLDRIAYLEKALADPTSLLVDYQQGKSGLIEIEHWAVRLLASSLADTLGDAPNAIVLDLTDVKTGQQLEVTIRRAPSGKSPAQIIGELRAENERLRHRVLWGETSPETQRFLPDTELAS